MSSFFCLFCFLTKRPWQVSTPSLTKGVLGCGGVVFCHELEGVGGSTADVQM